MEKNVEIHSHSQADLNPLGCVSCESEEALAKILPNRACHLRVIKC
ncbi:hypothetical protein [Helicobacter typhlonius]